jgi:hypothetical protein
MFRSNEKLLIFNKKNALVYIFIAHMKVVKLMVCSEGQ